MNLALARLRCARLVLLAAASLAATAASATDASGAPAAPASTASPGGDATPFVLDADPDYAHYRRAVVEYLVARKAHGPAHVCVLGERDGGGGRSASVWWREGARIIEWDGRDAPLATSTSNLDLKRDVVATQDDLHGSTYLVTRQWVADFKSRCTRHGVSFVVRPAEIAAARQSH